MLLLISESIWVQMTLEEAIGYVASDELIEVPPDFNFIRPLVSNCEQLSYIAI